MLIPNRHAGEDCLYIGNGPSLNQMNFTFVHRFAAVMGANKLHLGFDRFRFKPTYLVAINRHVINQTRDVYEQMGDDILKLVRRDRWHTHANAQHAQTQPTRT